MTTWRARIILGAVVVVVLCFFFWWAFTRGEDPLEEGFVDPTIPSGTLPRDQEEPPFDDPIDEPELEEDPGDPPSEDIGQTEQPRWPMVSDEVIAQAGQSFELAVAGGGRVLVLVTCDSPELGTSIAVAAVGLDPDADVVGLLSPPTDLQPGLMTDADGNGFKITVVDLPEPSYTLTFDTLGNLSVSFAGCPAPDEATDS